MHQKKFWRKIEQKSQAGIFVIDTLLFKFAKLENKSVYPHFAECTFD